MDPRLAEVGPSAMKRSGWPVDEHWTAAREALWQTAETVIGDGDFNRKACWTAYGHQGAEKTISVKGGGRTLRFERTCPYSPEQYDVFKGHSRVGYVRLRHGRLTADYFRRRWLERNRVEVLRQYFGDRHEPLPARPGNFWVGAFLNQEQRLEWLTKITEMLVPLIDEEMKSR